MTDDSHRPGPLPLGLQRGLHAAGPAAARAGQRRAAPAGARQGGRALTDVREKAAAFRALHEGPAFVIPNPWDAGSAKVLEALGFEALASTSSGFAFTLGRQDGEATLDAIDDALGDVVVRAPRLASFAEEGVKHR